MTELPLISVAMCTYNGERYLQSQIDSILNQTHAHIELVIVDDGSTDNTYELSKAYERQDNRVKCVKNEHNLGFNRNFEKALSLTTGPYIAISDQDDIWELNKLELLLKHIGNHWLIFSNSNKMNFAGEWSAIQLLTDFKFEGHDYKSLLLQNWVTGHTTLFARAFLDYILPFPKNGYYDWWMGFVAAYHHKLTFLNQALTHYRIHSSSVIQQEKKNHSAKLKAYQLQVILDMIGEIEKFKNLHPDDSQFIQQLKEALILKKERWLSVPLLKLVYKYYQQLFIIKKRIGFSKLNFAYKYAKGIEA
jgi:glycosyltransferase involved in cell wall biosynthesis